MNRTLPLGRSAICFFLLLMGCAGSQETRWNKRNSSAQQLTADKLQDCYGLNEDLGSEDFEGGPRPLPREDVIIVDPTNPRVPFENEDYPENQGDAPTGYNPVDVGEREGRYGGRYEDSRAGDTRYDRGDGRRNQSKGSRDVRPCKGDGQIGDEPIPVRKRCKACDNDDDVIQKPGQYPTQRHIEADRCGKRGVFCDQGEHPGQWPGQTVRGGPYHRGDFEKCVGAFRAAGYDTRGMWGLDARKITNVSVLSNAIVEDHGIDHAIIIINSVNVLGVTRYRLFNPNALYCIKDVSVLDDVRISSCYSSNVVFGSSVNVLSRVDSRVVDCR